jgi:hypothetical protein
MSTFNHQVNEIDFLGLCQKHLPQGKAYQTLISSVLHKYVSGAWAEK